MGISRSLPIPTTTPVLPGTAVQQSIYTDAGFTAGDYVYRYNGNSVGALPYITGASSLPGAPIPVIIAGRIYNFYSGSGNALSRSSITTPTTIPSTYTATLPKISSIGSNYLAAQTVFAYANSYPNPKCALLTNGNIVIVYQSAATTLSYKIYNVAGTVLYSGDISNTAINISYVWQNQDGLYDVCALNSGGFAVLYNTQSSLIYVSTYSSTGSLIATSTDLSSGSNVYPYLGTICADKTDCIYIASSNSTNGSLYLSKLSPSLVYLNKSTGLGNTGGCPPKITITLSGHLGYAMNYSAGTSANYGLYNLDLNTAYGSSSSISGVSGTTCVGICPSLSSSGGMFISVVSTGTVAVRYLYVNPNASNSTISVNTTIAGLNPTTGAYNLVPVNSTTSGVYDGTSNSVVITFRSSTGSNYGSLIVNLASDNLTYTNGSRVTITPSIGSAGGYYSASSCPCPAAAVVIAYSDTTGYPSFALVGTYTYASTSATVSTISSAQPNQSNGYSLIGVATNTAAAGSYGNVIINGVATLASTYATSSTSYGFNFNARNGNGFLGNKGYVVNRVVTLQGLE